MRIETKTPEYIRRNKATIKKDLVNAEKSARDKLKKVLKRKNILENALKETVEPAWRVEQKNTAKAQSLKSNFGISIEQYKEKLEKQKGLCGICSSEGDIVKGRSLAVDHCHDSLKIRGLLCMKCNTGLGHFNDSKELLLKAIAYLNLHNPEEPDGKT